MNCIAYHVVAAIVGTALAMIIVIVIALDLVELAVLDENPGGFVEHLCEDFGHLGQRIWGSGYRLLFSSLYRRRLCQGYIHLRITNELVKLA